MDETKRVRTAPRQRVVDRIRFAVELLMLRGLRYRLLLAALIVLAVSLVGGSLVAILDSGSSTLGENIWWAFLRLTDPGYLGDDEGLARRTVSTLVTVLGYVLFLGLLIAILTQWLNQVIQKLESGVTPVALRNHVIILGWTHRTPTIVAELLQTRGRVRRFLESHGAGDLRIVVLAEQVDEARLQELRERLGSLWSDRSVFLRSGTTLRIEHLERVAYLDAAVLILPGADFGEDKPESIDAQTIKTLMAISEHAAATGATPPLAVAEIQDGRRAPVARQAYDGEIEILAADDVISRLIAQSVRERGLCDVVLELLTLNAGNAFYIRKIDGQAGRSFGELRGMFSGAILIGIAPSGGGRPALNPDPETVLGEEDWLVLIAPSFADCTPDPEARSDIRYASVEAAEPPRRERRILILGWNRKAPALLAELEQYGGSAFEIDIVSSAPLADREHALKRHGPPLEGLRIRHIEDGYTQHGVLESLDPGRCDNIIMLASERIDGEAAADATTIFGYLTLRGLLSKEGPRPRIFVELLDDENEFLFRRHDEDVIVSPTMISYLLSQVSLRRELAAVVAELFRTWGAQIALAPAHEYLGEREPVRFDDAVRAAAARGEIALGLQRPAGSGARLELNPDRDTEWTLTPEDRMVVLRLYREPESAS